MKLLSIIALLLAFNTANAETPFYVCGLGEVQKIATLDPIGSDLKDAPLAPSEVTFLERAIDDKFDCDEGVELLGAELATKGSQKVYFAAKCSKDSLGTKKVKIELNCKDDYLN